MADYRRHDIADEEWSKLEPLLPGGPGKVGRPADDNRRFINAVKWIFRTGAPWRDLPPEYGAWKATHTRFYRWRDRGVWEKRLEALSGEPDMEGLMIDASPVKAHAHASGAKGGIRRWEQRKAANPSGRRCSRHAGQDPAYRRSDGRLYASARIDKGFTGRRQDGRQGIRYRRPP